MRTGSSLLLATCILLPADAWAPTKSLTRRQPLFASSSTQHVSLNLEDSWEDISRFISVSAQSAPDVSDVVKAVKKIRWDQWWTEETRVSLTEALHSAVVVYQGLPLALQVLLPVLPVASAFATTLYALSFPPEDFRADHEPYRRGNYDPVQAEAYYRRNLGVVLQRMLQVFRLSQGFLFNILVDKYIFRDEERQQPKRAKELLDLITQLGPTAIKVGQALSVRADLIPEAYASSLATLQDRVPPFSTDKARALLLEQWGPERYAQLPIYQEAPVASASIGQVYKAKLGDKDVAVKVQRPNVLSEIALDLFIVRTLAPVYQAITKTSTDLQSLANEWGRGFIAELDYRDEAASTIKFNEEMKKRNLNAVCAPTIVTEFSTEQILVSEWVEGTRIDQSQADDIPRLCAVALNAYLVMLLELKSLHCDPHPGNLLRTTDGKLCILDFGMTLDIENDLQYSLLEYVAHLTAQDYDRLPEDLAALGFLKSDKVDFARRSGILEPLKYFLKQASEGGGANGVRDRIFAEYREKYPGMDDEQLRDAMRGEMKEQMQSMVDRESVASGVTIEVEELQRRNRDSFQIPEWFLYTSRAFLTLEGVSLQADPNYSLIKSCFPYVAKRLVGDQDPRARQALRDLIYGAGDAVDVERLADLADGFSSYTRTTKTINEQAPAHAGELILSSGAVEPISKRKDRKDKLIETEAAILLAKDSADILLAEDGNIVQSILVEESALATSARFKDSARDVLVDAPKAFRKSLPFGVGSFLPPLPFEQLEPFFQKTEQEVKAQNLARKLASIATQSTSEPRSESTGEAISVVMSSLRELEPEQAALVLREIRENAPRYASLAGRLGEKFVDTLAKTARTNFETTMSKQR